jgi:ribose 5-phosphate isomerase B
MTSLTIALACDHAGYALKEQLKETLAAYGFVRDLGAHDESTVDYPDYGHAAARLLASGEAQFAVALCGSGLGICMAAGKHPGVRAAACETGLAAHLARRHNDANMLCLGARLIGVETARDCVRQFFTTAFEGGRHQRRVARIEPF